MTTDDRFGRTLATWLHEDAEHRMPDHLAEVLVATVATRQRRWWSSPERWLPMDTLAAPRPANLRPILILALIGALLIALLGVIAIGTPPSIPVPGLATNGRIFVVDGATLRSFDANGGDARDVMTLPEGTQSLAVSPDGTRLAYVPLDAPVRIEFVSIDGGSPVTAFVEGAHALRPWLNWSPDGSSVAVVMTDGSQHLMLAPAAGGAAREVVFDPSGDSEVIGSVDWSPDGTRLAVAASPAEGVPGQVFVVGSNGRNPRTLATSPVAAGAASWVGWSPDPATDRLVYATATDPPHVVTFDLEAGVETAVGPGFWPTWSPDGSRIAFWDDGTVVVSTDDALAGRVEPEYVFEIAAHTQTGKAPLPGRFTSCQNPEQLLGNEICQAVAWSPDGTAVYGPDINGGSLVVAQIDGDTRPTFIELDSPGEIVSAWQPVAP